MKSVLVLIFLIFNLFSVQCNDEVEEAELVKIPSQSLRRYFQKIISLHSKPTDENPSGWILLLNNKTTHKIRKHHGRRRPCPHGMKIDHLGECRKPWK
uniref:Putative secreted protein n=1 Tax=Panstrongylus lignarius TaxID=156445 RepID=A0A224XUV9_9HEMI